MEHLIFNLILAILTPIFVGIVEIFFTKGNIDSSMISKSFSNEILDILIRNILHYIIDGLRKIILYYKDKRKIKPKNKYCEIDIEIHISFHN